MQKNKKSYPALSPFVPNRPDEDVKPPPLFFPKSAYLLSGYLLLLDELLPLPKEPHLLALLDGELMGP
jgi:hypothetical protein